VNVRVAQPADAEAMARVHWLSSNVAYGRDDPFERRLATTREVFELEHVRHFLAEDADGAVIGVAILSDDELYALYVHPDWWGSGAGQLLLDEAQRALAETTDEAHLTVLVTNARARRFYERNGWTLYEEVTEPHFGGVPTAVAKYRRRFEPVSDTGGL
jgi:ribosomal protein S18 acetylase RimI-like enzyme